MSRPCPMVLLGKRLFRSVSSSRIWLRSAVSLVDGPRRRPSLKALPLRFPLIAPQLRFQCRFISSSTARDSNSALLSLETAQEALCLAEEALRESAFEHLFGRGSRRGKAWGCEVVAKRAPHKSADGVIRNYSEFEQVDPMMLLDVLTHNPREPLDDKHVINVLGGAAQHFFGAAVSDIAPPLVDVLVPHGPGARLVMVGDLHGQLADLLFIFHQHGVPSPSNAYLFNGDISDRGPHAVEMWVLILAFMLRFPRSVTVLRGNHENAAMNQRPAKFGGGFAADCHMRYKSLPLLYRNFQRLFLHLPLFGVVENQIFVVHAGLPRLPGITLTTLRSIDHRRHYPGPRTKKGLEKGKKLKWTLEDTILFDAQWADPHDGLGLKQSPRGSDCVYFGSDVTEAFLEENGLDLVIRSHEVPRTMRGARYQHDGKLLTLFSASLYGGSLKNSGAVAFIQQGKDDKLFVTTYEHVAPGLDQIPGMMGAAYDQHETARARVQRLLARRASSARLSALNDSDDSFGDLGSQGDGPTKVMQMMVDHLKAIICVHRDDLWNFCAWQDESKDGFIDATAFALEVGRHAHVGADDSEIWLPVLDQGLGAVDGQGFMDYNALLTRFRVQWSLENAASLSSRSVTGGSARAEMQSLIGAILKAELTLQQTMALFDRDLSDFVSLSECRQVLTELLPGLSRRQVHYVLQELQGAWGTVQEVKVFRFMVALCMEFPAPRPPGAKAAPSWLPDALLQASQHFIEMTPTAPVGSKYALGEALLQNFRGWDAEGSGLLTTAEVLTALSKETEDGPSLQAVLGISDEQLRELVDYLDANGDGTLSIFELLHAFNGIGDAGSRDDRDTGSAESDTGDSRLPADSLSEDVNSTLLAVLKAHSSTLYRCCRALDLQTRGTLGRLEFTEVVTALLKAVKEHDVLHPNLTMAGAPHIEDLRECLPTEVEYVNLLASLRIVDRR